MARVRTLLRRGRRAGAPPDEALRVGALAVDPVRYRVSVDGAEVACTRSEFAILSAMAAQPDRVFTRQQLLERTSGYESFATERTVDMHVSNLRRKIEPAPRRPVYLLTVYGIGYKLTDGSARQPAPPAAPAGEDGRAP
jgi:DNA-binding response OmpR family regulator